MARKLLIAGNWKMNQTLPEARALMRGLREGLDARVGDWTGIEVLVFPPATVLFPMAKELAACKFPIAMGAQTAHFERSGAFTGEVSAAMVKDTGCTHVLVGHSERRHVFGESAQMLARKVRAGLAEGLIVVYCVGETLAERDAGRTGKVVERQLSEGLDDSPDLSRLVIAYEPVWAIGTGRNATPAQAQEVHSLMRKWLGDRFGDEVAGRMRILYGGSVKPDNAEALMCEPDVDGVLVGGASLVVGDFLGIIGAGATCARGGGVASPW